MSLREMITTDSNITMTGGENREVVRPSLAITIGRSEDNTIQLLDPKTSRFHCKIEQTAEGLVLSDLQSKNGTFVNGQKCDTAPLVSGDVLRIGSNTLMLPPTTTAIPTATERTTEAHVLPWVEPEGERTREIDAPKQNIFSRIPTLTPGNKRLHLRKRIQAKVEITSFLRRNKIFVIAITISLLPVLAFTFNLLTSSLPQNSQLAMATVTLDKKPKLLPPAEVSQNKPSHKKNIEKATQIAREANTIFDTGDFTQAISLYNQALNYDPDNILAKQGLGATLAYVENLAQICFARGQKCLKAFDYQAAIKEFETVLLLLQDRQSHALYMDATKLIRQAQFKVND